MKTRFSGFAMLIYDNRRFTGVKTGFHSCYAEHAP